MRLRRPLDGNESDWPTGEYWQPLSWPTSGPAGDGFLGQDPPAGLPVWAGATAAAAESEVAYISGIAADGSFAGSSFWSYAGEIPHKWAGGLAGTAGGTVTYAFDPAAAFTATEIATWKQGLALWSAVADIQFAEVAAADAHQVTLLRGSDGGAYEYDSYFISSSPTLGQMISAAISIDTSVFGFDLSGSFSLAGGYGVSTVVHEIGHLLGLGHGGPYNGSVNPATQQFSAFDSRFWSVMSYIQPNAGTAQYYADYPVSGANWGGAVSPHTWMPVDLLAVQRLYGAATSGPLAGGQVFGFNTNLDASIRPFFDFTVNSAPVITLYSAGLGNTLDLSGYAAAQAIDLRDGHFSSVGGLANNLAIAFGTRIDTAIGGSGNDAFHANGHGNTFHGGGGSDEIHFASPIGAYTITITGAHAGTVTSGSEVNSFTGVETLVFDDTIYAVACFVHDTRIATPGGEAAVEGLAIGDLVRLADGGSAAVKWLGRRRYSAAQVAANPQLRPVRIRAGALGRGLPLRDLQVSPCHALLVDDVLIPAGALVNGTSIDRADPASVAYVHIELETPDLVLAEGAAAETFVDCANRLLFDNAAEFARLYPTAAPGVPRHPRPRLEDGPLVARARRRLAGSFSYRPPGALHGRIERIADGIIEGWVLDSGDPENPVALEVRAAGLPPALVWANRYRADLDRAGLAGGRCGFRHALPPGAALLALHRAADGARVPHLQAG